MSRNFNPTDRALAAELAAFLPETVFDAHAHLYRARDMRLPENSFLARQPEIMGARAWRACLGGLVGEERLRGALFIPHITAGCDVEAANRFLLGELAGNPDCLGLLLIRPDERPDDELLAGLENPRVAGFKPYHLFSREKPTWQSTLDGYLPDWAWAEADRRKLAITLHLVRDGALADPDNQRRIREKCLAYPGAKLVLAHAGRGFHAPNTVRGVAALRGLDNVWFDAAAVCEALPLLAILDEFGPGKLLWGTDFPVCLFRGRTATVGDGFAWFTGDNFNWAGVSPAVHPTLVGLESLRALREAADTFGLNRPDIADIFAGNARRLLGLDARPETGQALYREARKIMPGGTQLLSKRPEMMAPEQWPAYFREARGCEVWDQDRRRYYDMSIHGIGSCLLGFRDPDVTRAVRRRVNLGSMSTLNPPEEVELARRLCRLHPWAEQARFARCGGEAAAIAVRIARATTGRDLVAFSGYHGWHDWYLAANLGASDALKGHLLPGLEPAGVPSQLRGTAFPFTHGSRTEFAAVTATHGDRLAAVIMEPCRGRDPEPGFLEFVREETRRLGTLLIFDEITVGFRLCLGGAHLKLGVNPDLAVFAKALGNGHPVAAIIGTARAMAGAHDSFISSTYWTEGVGPTAALACLDKMARVDVPGHIRRMGLLVRDAWRREAERYRLPLVVQEGYPCFARFAFAHEQGEQLRTLFTQWMLEEGFLAGNAVYLTLAHDEAVIGLYRRAAGRVFARLAGALAENRLAAELKGPVAQQGFRRLL